MEHPHHQQTGNIAEGNHQQPEQLPSPNFGKRKGKRKRMRTGNKETSRKKRERDWKETETSALLRCVNLPEFKQQKRKQTYMKWDAIAEEIQKSLGLTDAFVTGKRCQERMKTLRGYYRGTNSKLDKMKKTKDDLTDDEWGSLQKLCGLTGDWWYEAIGAEYSGGPRQGKGGSGMRCDLGQNVSTDRPSNSLISTVTGSSDQPVLLENSSDQPVFPDNSSDQPVFPSAPVLLDNAPDPVLHENSSELGNSDGRRSSEPGLLENSIVSESVGGTPTKLGSSDGGRSADKQIAIPGFNFFSKSRRSTLLDLIFKADFVRHCRTRSNLCGWLSIVQNRSCSEIYEDVFALEKRRFVSTFCVRCQEVDCDNECKRSEVDEEDIFPACINCSRLQVFKKFFAKTMLKNPAYDTRRRIQINGMLKFDVMSAPQGLTVLILDNCEGLEMVDLSGFPKLRSLTIWRCPKLGVMIGWESLEELGWLEIQSCPSDLGYPPCQKVPSLQEFRFELDVYDSLRSCGLPARELDVSRCIRLRTLQIYRDKTLSSIRGLEGLHSLTALRLWDCSALQKLPDIGHMKDLTDLDIRDTAVEEIKGVEKLSSLKELDCWGSKLKTLPDLIHLPHLRRVSLGGCPVTNDPLSVYFNQGYVQFNLVNNHVDVSDISGDECDLSDGGT